MSNTAEPMLREPGSRRLIALIATVLIFGALKATTVVMLPFVFAIFLIAVFWPLQKWFDERMREGLAVFLTLLVFLICVGLLLAASWYAIDQIEDRAPEYQEPLQRQYQKLEGWLEGYGLNLPGAGTSESDGGNSLRMLRRMLDDISRSLFGLLGAAILVLAYFVLGLHEVRDFHAKVRRMMPPDRADRWLDATARITTQFQRYIVIRTALGLLTGTAVWLGSLAIGLEFAFVWGLINFVLNYIPTVGSILAVVPPVLFALLQSEDATKPLLALVVVGGVQMVTGNYIDPLLEGRYLKISPLVVLVSVAFWGWMWGATGAFISVPITVGIIIACREFERTEWIATLLSDVDDSGEPAET